MMLDFLGDADEAKRVTAAVERMTRDPGLTTSQIGDAVIGAITLSERS
jgi:isocitrate/isopropylmalate dehydrogenase